MGRPFMAPPGVPPERAQVLREAFLRTMKDPQFLADADKAKLEITPVSGADIEKLVREVYGTSKETAAEAAAMIR
jgi:tripartite-type tricarboxylate transporter receptor subunit TctC